MPKAVAAVPDAELSGTVGRIIYKSKDSAFCVFTVEGHTIAGQAYGLSVGDNVKAHGTWSEHPKYGKQFNAAWCERIIAGTAEAAFAYLSSGLIKGVGTATAKRIVAALGPDAVEIISAPDGIKHLAKIRGISAKKAADIAESVAETFSQQKFISHIVRHGGTPRLATKCIEKYGNSALDKVTQNPYILTDIARVGFAIADRIGLSMGYARDGEFRLRAGLMHILSEDRNGHCMLPRQEAISSAAELLDIQQQMLELVIPGMVKAHMIRDHAGYLQVEALARAEEQTASIVQRLLSGYKPIPGASAAVSRFEREQGMVLTSRQRDAVVDILSHRIFILTGGPGTGKTTTMKAVVNVARQLNPSWTIALCAPTGRASRRLAEVTGESASTIHRLLAIHDDNSEPEQIAAEFVIVDEASMIDIRLAAKLFKALHHNARILIVGDADQLPSVGPGNVLRDLLKCVPSLSLNEILRQARDSQIISNAHNLNMGITRSLETGRDFHFYEAKSAEAIHDQILAIVKQYLKKYGTIDTLQVLSPMKKGPAGVNALNASIQEAVNPPTPAKPELKRHMVFRLNDRVMCLENDYQRNVFNGDIGKILAIDIEDAIITVEFPLTGEVEYPIQDTDTLTLAYATTVHKSQGSEYPVVLVPVTTAHYIMLMRNLFYTAITRAQRHLALIGTRQAYHIAATNSKVASRHTRLPEIIQEKATRAKAARTP